jgi:hypothetical protein
MTEDNPKEVPFVAAPDRTERPPMNDLVCFNDKDRACGPDCMAYTLNTPGAEYNDMWAHCLYLTSLFRISKHVILLAQQGDENMRLVKNATADLVRAGNGPVVPPFVPPGAKRPDQ